MRNSAECFSISNSKTGKTFQIFHKETAKFDDY